MKKSLLIKRTSCMVFLLGVVAMAGCPAKREVTPPETFPVSGKVISRSPLPAGYQVEFIAEDSEKNASGKVQPDGTFKLTTRYLGVVCEGAAQGTYTVSLNPPIGLLNSGVMPYVHPQPVQVDAELTDLKIPFPSR